MHRRTVLATLTVIAVALLGACAHGSGATGAAASSAIYWCGSATDGPCSGISSSPGTCPGGSPMNAGHVIGMEGNTALVCPCGASCTCKINPADRTKCGCGKAVRRIDLSGSGIYVCGCGNSCDCYTVSDKPGNCRCGQPLKQVK
jgi:hypothetical protein